MDIKKTFVDLQQDSKVILAHASKMTNGEAPDYKEYDYATMAESAGSITELIREANYDSREIAQQISSANQIAVTDVVANLCKSLDKMLQVRLAAETDPTIRSSECSRLFPLAVATSDVAQLLGNIINEFSLESKAQETIPSWLLAAKSFLKNHVAVKNTIMKGVDSAAAAVRYRSRGVVLTSERAESLRRSLAEAV